MAVDKKANLFIVGAMRAGTTSLMEILEQHPSIYSSPIKEPHFFVDELPKEVYSPNKYFSIENYFKNDFPKKLHIAHVKNRAHYDQLFLKAEGQKYRLDASTCYLHAPNVAEKIKRYNPQAKIIILIRDPLERMQSHFYMDKGLLRTRSSFQNIAEKQLEALQKGKLNWYSHLNMSFYDRSVATFKDNFEDVITISFQDYTTNTNAVLQMLVKFLDIESFSFNESVAMNKTRELKRQKLYFMLKRLGMKDLATAVFPAKVRQRIFRLLSTKNKKELLVSEMVKKELHHIFSNESSKF